MTRISESSPAPLLEAALAIHHRRSVSRQTPRDSFGTVESAQIGPHVVITSMAGHITAAVVEDRATQFRYVLERVSCASWILDQSQLTGLEPAAVSVASRWFDTFRSAGGKELLLVSTHAAARMAAATNAFRAGVPARSFEELRDALDALGLRPDSPSITRLEPASVLTAARSAPTLPLDARLGPRRRR